MEQLLSKVKLGKDQNLLLSYLFKQRRKSENKPFSMLPQFSKKVARSKDKIEILVVDDDVDMTETLSDIITTLGIQVEVAHDGLQALKKVKTKRFDMVLIDIKMPKMNGIECFKEIKKIRPQTTAKASRRIVCWSSTFVTCQSYLSCYFLMLIDGWGGSFGKDL